MSKKTKTVVAMTFLHILSLENLKKSYFYGCLKVKKGELKQSPKGLCLLKRE